MRIERHLAKAERFEAIRQKLDPKDDFELWMWMAMNGATQYLNAALHHLGLSEETDTYPGGSNLQVRWSEQGWLRGPGVLGDVTHTDRSPIDVSGEPIIVEAAEHLDAIENLREVYVRGPEAATDEVIVACERNYLACRDAALRALLIDRSVSRDAKGA